MNIASIIALTALLVSLVGPSWLIADLIFVMMSFEAMAVVPPELMGGISLTPGSLAAFFLILRSIFIPGMLPSILRTLLDTRRLGWLGGFFIIAVIGAILLPRVFSGEIMIYSLHTASLTELAPGTTNFTQTCYLFLAIMTAAVICVRVSKEASFTDTLLKGILAGGYAVLATGLVDMVATTTGHEDLLVKMFHTANYGYSTGEILGATRILGLTPEPSSFGGLASSLCGILLFLRPAYPRHLWKWKVPVAAWGCAIMAFLSTSSTAYASMFVVLALYVLYNTSAISETGFVLRKSAISKIAWGLFLIVILVVVSQINDRVLNYAVNMVDTLIFKKQYSQSYIERSSWTRAGLSAFFSSYGLGIGVGSVRTSNFFVNLIASTGVPGTFLFFVFLAKLYLWRAPSQNIRENVIIRAAKLSLLPIFASLFLAGTTPDFGILPGVLFGLIAGLVTQARHQIKQPLSYLSRPKQSLEN